MALLTGLLGWGRPSHAAVETLLVIEPTPEYPRNSEGDVIELSDGRLALIYTRFSGGFADNAAAEIVLRTADAAGTNWSEPRIVVPRGDSKNVMSVSTARGRNGEWLLFYLRRGEGWNDCRLLVRRSSDEFKTLTEPVPVTVLRGYHVVNNDRVVRLSTGRLIVPAALHPCPDGTQKTWSPRATCLAYMSDDDGRTWHAGSGAGQTQAAATSSPSEAKKRPVTLQEPGIVELKDGRLMMWMRTSESTQYQSFSSDGGEHWTAPESGPLISARLSPASIHRIPWSGNLLAVWNDHAGVRGGPTGNRTPLSIAISSNDGRTWSSSRPIETDPAGSYCYTSITFVKDRVILTYCAGDKKIGNLNRLKMVAVGKHELPTTRFGP